MLTQSSKAISIDTNTDKAILDETSTDKAILDDTSTDAKDTVIPEHELIPQIARYASIFRKRLGEIRTGNQDTAADNTGLILTSAPTERSFEEVDADELRNRKAQLYKWFDSRPGRYTLSPTEHNRMHAKELRRKADQDYGQKTARSASAASKLPCAIDTNQIPDCVEAGRISLFYVAGDNKKPTEIAVPILVDAPEGTFCRIERKIG